VTELGVRLLDLGIALFALVFLVRPQDFLGGGTSREERADASTGVGARRARTSRAATSEGEGETDDSAVPTVGFVRRAAFFGERPDGEPSWLEPGRIVGMVVVAAGLALASGLV
jgi:hypothetical protein